MMETDRESRIDRELKADRELIDISDPDLFFDEEKHLYSIIVDGEPKNVPSVTKVLQRVGIYNYRKGEEAIKRMRRGTRIHKLTEYMDLGDDESLAITAHQDDLTVISAWDKFKKEQGFEISHIEQRFAHREYWFAGTVDRIGWLGEDAVLIDIKTGSPHPANKLQVAAYAILVEDRNIHVDRAMSVYLGDNDYKIIEVPSISKGFGVFMGVLSVYRWMEENMGYKIIPQGG